jgi:hypothetical protein
VLDPGAGSSAGASDYGTWPRKPAPGELRKVRIDKYDKSTEPLGIQISCKANGGGVFVSSVNENSLASQVGLQVHLLFLFSFSIKMDLLFLSTPYFNAGPFPRLVISFLKCVESTCAPPHMTWQLVYSDNVETQLRCLFSLLRISIVRKFVSFS